MLGANANSIGLCSRLNPFIGRFIFVVLSGDYLSHLCGITLTMSIPTTSTVGLFQAKALIRLRFGWTALP